VTVRLNAHLVNDTLRHHAHYCIVTSEVGDIFSSEPFIVSHRMAVYLFFYRCRSPSAHARQAGTRICQDEEVLRDSPVLARLVKRSPNELLCGTSII